MALRKYQRIESDRVLKALLEQDFAVQAPLVSIDMADDRGFVATRNKEDGTEVSVVRSGTDDSYYVEAYMESKGFHCLRQFGRGSSPAEIADHARRLAFGQEVLQ